MSELDMSEFDIFGTKIGKDFRRGLLKVFILKMLSTKDMHGYALIKRIEKATDGRWKPSSGSIYPALINLKTAGMIKAKIVGTRHVYSITAKGRESMKGADANFDTIVDEITKIFKKL